MKNTTRKFILLRPSHEKLQWGFAEIFSLIIAAAVLTQVAAPCWSTDHGQQSTADHTRSMDYGLWTVDEILRPLAAGERRSENLGGLKIELKLKPDDMYKDVIIGVVKDKAKIEDALRQSYQDPDISLETLQNVIISRSGFGNTKYVYHLRFVFDDGREMDLALYIFWKGASYRKAESGTLTSIHSAIAKTGRDNITVPILNTLDFEEIGISGKRTIHHCALAEYGGVDLQQVENVFWKLFKNQAATFKEEDAYKLVEIGIISDEEARLLAVDKKGLEGLVKMRLKIKDIDEFILRRENTGVAKYFQLYKKTDGRYVTGDPRRNNVLFRYDRYLDKWVCRLCDLEDAGRNSLGEYISSFVVFEKMYYEPMQFEGLTIRHASSAGVRSWHWTDKPISGKTGFFKAAMTGLGGGEQAKKMLSDAWTEIGQSAQLMGSDNCPYDALRHFLMKIGYVGYLKLAEIGATSRETKAQLEASILRPLAAGERLTGKTTKMRSYPHRLENIDPYMISLLNGRSTLFVDAGAGWRPDPSIEFADKIASTHPQLHVIASDINFPAMVIETNFVPPGLHSMATALFNEEDELIAVNGIPFSFTGEQLQQMNPEAFRAIMEVKEELLEKAKHTKDTTVTNEGGTKMIIDPLSSVEFQRRNLTYLREDILQSTIRAETVDVIRDFNMTAIYYTEPAEKAAMIEAEGRLLKEGGHLLLGLSSELTKNEEFMDYRKETGRVKPYKFIFSVDPLLVRVEYPGAKSGIGKSYFNKDRQLDEDYLRVIISMIPAECRAEGFDYFYRMIRHNPDYYNTFINDVVAGLKQTGYIASVAPGNLIALSYLEDGLLRQPLASKCEDIISTETRSQLETSI